MESLDFEEVFEGSKHTPAQNSDAQMHAKVNILQLTEQNNVTQAERLRSNLFTLWAVYITGVSDTVHNMSHLSFQRFGGQQMMLGEKACYLIRIQTTRNTQLLDREMWANLPGSRLNEQA